jgi:hypothetical protein
MNANSWRRAGARSVLVALVAITACGRPGTPSPVRHPLVVKFLYPAETSSLQMGTTLKTIIEVQDERGRVVKDAAVTLGLLDPSGTIQGEVAAQFGDGDVYRSAPWIIPHMTRDGTWTATVSASTPTAEGTASTPFEVRYSIGETLLHKYGFWIDDPTFKGIHTDLMKERGDARNGAILWGGVLPNQHIFTESWLEVQWRQGDFDLTSPQKVRAFMLGTLGDIGFTPVRQIGLFEPVKFRQWDAWQATVRGQYSRYDGQWLVFYAPEVGKTYAIGTTVVQAPTGIDMHEKLRSSFEVHPELHASGVAPQPLAHLLPAPELISPELGARFAGSEAKVVLSWKPVRELAPDEYYRVHIDFNYVELNTLVNYTTRETQFTIPVSLFQRPNCAVFNWQITLMRQTGTDADGQPTGTPLSYNSLYWYVQWFYPPDEPAPFPPRCPNPQT